MGDVAMAYSDDEVTQVHLRALRSGMRLTALKSPPTKVSEAEIDAVIAKTLAENRQIAARAALPEIAHQDELTGLAGRNARREAVQDGAAAARLRNVSAQYAPQKPAAKTIEDLTGRTPTILQKLKAWPLLAFLFAAVVAIFALAPWVIPLALLLGAGFVVALGSDRVAGGLTRIYHWRHARNPARAERFRNRIDQLATGMDAVLDRLPERWTTGLYMPDFSREALLEDIDQGRPDPFDRIAAEMRQV